MSVDGNEGNREPVDHAVARVATEDESGVSDLEDSCSDADANSDKSMGLPKPILQQTPQQ